MAHVRDGQQGGVIRDGSETAQRFPNPLLRTQFVGPIEWETSSKRSVLSHGTEKTDR